MGDTQLSGGMERVRRIARTQSTKLKARLSRGESGPGEEEGKEQKEEQETEQDSDTPIRLPILRAPVKTSKENGEK